MARSDDRGEPGGAEPVDRHACDRFRQAREQPGHARDVAIVLAGLVGAAEVHVLDVARLDARALHGRGDRDRREVVGTDVRELAAVAPDRRAHRGEQDGAPHSAPLLVQHFLRDREGAVGRRGAAVDRGLQQHLLDLVGREAVAQRGAHVHGELALAAERDERGQRDRAAHAPVDSGPRPDTAPDRGGDQLLEICGEVGRALDRAVHVGVAEHLAADPHAALVCVIARAAHATSVAGRAVR